MYGVPLCYFSNCYVCVILRKELQTFLIDELSANVSKDSSGLCVYVRVCVRVRACVLRVSVWVSLV